EPDTPRPAHGARAVAAREAVVVERDRVREERRQLVRRSARRVPIPGTGGVAEVAPEDPPGEKRPERAVDRALVLDRQVRDAAPRPEAVPGLDRGRRARREAAIADATAVDRRRVGLELERDQH